MKFTTDHLKEILELLEDSFESVVQETLRECSKLGIADSVKIMKQCHDEIMFITNELNKVSYCDTTKTYRSVTGNVFYIGDNGLARKEA